MDKRVAIIGGGIAGLVACKHLAAKGLNPTVFEAEEKIGGVWAKCIESTKLQTPRQFYEFPDFPWPSSVQELYPTSKQVLSYLQSYVEHFGLLQYIKFGSKVVSLDYVGVSDDEIQSWDLWGGSGRAFGSDKGKWHLLVQHRAGSLSEYVAEFVVICTGKFSGVPEFPEFPPGRGPEAFEGKVIHSVDYAAMDNQTAAEFIKGKRIAVVGSQKSAVDLAAECAKANGSKIPCTLIQRKVNWMLPGAHIMGINLVAVFGTRFAELLFHKPGEGFIYSFLATLLSPLRWALLKMIESYLKWRFPLKKHNMIPKHSLLKQYSACKLLWLPENFFERVEQGSLILKQSDNVSFCKRGLVLDSQPDNPIEADIVIFATGYKSREKLRDLFSSVQFQNHIMSSSSFLYRQMIPPRIPGVAIIGYSEGYLNLLTFELRCRWLACFLDGGFEMPNVKEMEKEGEAWGKYMKEYGGEVYRGACVGGLHIWYVDQLCRDVGFNPRRKNGMFSDLVLTYYPPDYASFGSHN